MSFLGCLLIFYFIPSQVGMLVRKRRVVLHVCKLLSMQFPCNFNHQMISILARHCLASQMSQELMGRQLHLYSIDAMPDPMLVATTRRCKLPILLGVQVLSNPFPEFTLQKISFSLSNRCTASGLYSSSLECLMAG